jgi:hypothetical protein
MARIPIYAAAWIGRKSYGTGAFKAFTGRIENGRHRNEHTRMAILPKTVMLIWRFFRIILKGHPGLTG